MCISVPYMYLGLHCWTIQISMHYLPHFAGSYDLAPSKFVTSARQLFTEYFERTASAFEAWATLSPDVSFLSISEPVDLRTSPIPPYNNSSIGLSKETGPDVRNLDQAGNIAVLSRTGRPKKKTRALENKHSLIDQTQSLSHHWQWTLKADCTTTSFVCFSSMLTMKHLLWLMSCRRNRISFVSFKVRVSCCWFVVKSSVIRISISLDLSSQSFIPLPRFIRLRLRWEPCSLGNRVPQPCDLTVLLRGYFLYFFTFFLAGHHLYFFSGFF